MEKNRNALLAQEFEMATTKCVQEIETKQREFATAAADETRPLGETAAGTQLDPYFAPYRASRHDVESVLIAEGNTLDCTPPRQTRRAANYWIKLNCNTSQGQTSPSTQSSTFARALAAARRFPGEEAGQIVVTVLETMEGLRYVRSATAGYDSALDFYSPLTSTHRQQVCLAVSSRAAREKIGLKPDAKFIPFCYGCPGGKGLPCTACIDVRFQMGDWEHDHIWSLGHAITVLCEFVRDDLLGSGMSVAAARDELKEAHHEDIVFTVWGQVEMRCRVHCDQKAKGRCDLDNALKHAFPSRDFQQKPFPSFGGADKVSFA